MTYANPPGASDRLKFGNYCLGETFECVPIHVQDTYTRMLTTVLFEIVKTRNPIPQITTNRKNTGHMPSDLIIQKERKMRMLSWKVAYACRIPALRGLRKEEHHEFGASLD